MLGSSTVANCVIKPNVFVKQGFILSKPCSSKKNKSIARLELVVAVMVAYFSINLQNSLTIFKIRSVQCWSNSMVVLHWFKGNKINKNFEKKQKIILH